ncbi:MAG: hypothetical protein KGH58_01370 [Candidatus Micrarchaeota archaeon]|nr:hypothetical protein [Candidatus Micrarchaeota archaeon]
MTRESNQLMQKKMRLETSYRQDLIREGISNGDCVGSVEHISRKGFDKDGNSWGTFTSANIRGVEFSMRYGLSKSGKVVTMDLGSLSATKAVHLDPTTYLIRTEKQTELDRIDTKEFRSMANEAKEVLLEAAIYHGIRNNFRIIVTNPEWTREVREYAQKRGYLITSGIDRYGGIRISEGKSTKLLRVVTDEPNLG